MPFVLAFIPLFFAIDVFGVLPIYVSLTERMSAAERLDVVRKACFTAMAIASGFIFLGEAIFSVLGVTTDDFRVAGGILLLVFAIQDLLMGGKKRRATSPTVAVVPLGMPLIVGPGVLTTSLLLVQHSGYLWTIVALIANLLIVYVALRSSGRIMAFIGAEGAVAAAKIASLLLATIGVMMVRLGVVA